MPLCHVLYRCPLCGLDPTEGRKDEVRCTGCGATFARAPRGVRVRADGSDSVETVAALVDRIRDHGGPLTEASNSDGSISYSSHAFFEGLLSEEPVRAGGRLLGYVERPRRPQEGILEVKDHGFSFRGVWVPRTRWPLKDVSALQVSTRSLQIGIRYAGTVQFTFPRASTFRWEELLHYLLRRAWRSEGRGEILEFQPRITPR